MQIVAPQLFAQKPNRRLIRVCTELVFKAPAKKTSRRSYSQPFQRDRLRSARIGDEINVLFRLIRLILYFAASNRSSFSDFSSLCVNTAISSLTSRWAIFMQFLEPARGLAFRHLSDCQFALYNVVNITYYSSNISKNRRALYIFDDITMR